MKIFTIGCGRWGAFIAWYLDSIGHTVSLWGREGSQRLAELVATRANGTVRLPDSITLTSDVEGARDADAVVISVPSQSLRPLLRSLPENILDGRTLVLCMKGIEIGSGKRLSQICREELGERVKVAVWLGPGHVQEFTAGRPNCMVIDSDDEEVKHKLISEFSSALIRFYYGTDLVGNEIGAAAKNVVGIAAGVLDALGLSSLKGALMARAPREISRLVEALGGNPVSGYGLCHIGDYEATVFSRYSHNRLFGECLVTGKEPEGLAEGYYTVKALVELGERLGVELPICTAVYNICYTGAAIDTEMEALFARSLKHEF